VGGLPMGKAADEWSYGDLEAGFKSAAIVVDETFVVQSTGHQPMETRSAMAYWQNGKLFLHGSTQSVARTLDPLASWLGMDAANIVLVSEYCGGGFGSKGAGAVLADERSEEHTSELQSLRHPVCRLLPGKKKLRRKGGRVA